MTAPRRGRVSIDEIVGELEQDFAGTGVVWWAEQIMFDHLPEVVDADLLQHFEVDEVMALTLSSRDADALRGRVRSWLASS